MLVVFLCVSVYVSFFFLFKYWERGEFLYYYLGRNFVKGVLTMWILQAKTNQQCYRTALCWETKIVNEADQTLIFSVSWKISVEMCISIVWFWLNSSLKNWTKISFCCLVIIQVICNSLVEWVIESEFLFR